MTSTDNRGALNIGWAQADITPQELPVYIVGQFHIRVSEGVRDPLQATALVLETGSDHVVLVSVDAVFITDPLRDAVRDRLHESGLDPQKVILHATHTHEGPNSNFETTGIFQRVEIARDGIDLGLRPGDEYTAFAAGRIADAISQAWQKRAPGGIAYGQEYAVLGRNRRWVDFDGKSTIYGLNADSAARFDHMEGYEDHSVNVLATYDADDVLTGVIVNLACPSQETENLFELSADFWCEARQELRARLGEHLFILPQCSAAGELTSHLIFETTPHERMLQLRGRTARQEIAVRLADAVGRVLPWLPPTIERGPLLEHHRQVLELPMNRLTEADVEDARHRMEEWQTQYEAEKRKMLEHPELQQEPRWYVPLTSAFNRIGWYQGVIERFEQTKVSPHYPVEVHVLRLGDVAFATNPFEYYLDFGIQIKVKSAALQTFIVQLAGSGSYVPSRRAAAGGGYGAVPASNPVGPEGGEVLAAYTIGKIGELWASA